MELCLCRDDVPRRHRARIDRSRFLVQHIISWWRQRSELRRILFHLTSVAADGRTSEEASPAAVLYSNSYTKGKIGSSEPVQGSDCTSSEPVLLAAAKLAAQITGYRRSIMSLDAPCHDHRAGTALAPASITASPGTCSSVHR